MAVNVLEGVLFAVRCWHQFDDAEWGVASNARDEVETLPLGVILLQIADHTGDDLFDTFALDPACHVVDIYKFDHECVVSFRTEFVVSNRFRRDYLCVTEFQPEDPL